MRGQQSMCWCHLFCFKWIFYVWGSGHNLPGCARAGTKLPLEVVSLWLGCLGEYTALWIYCCDSNPDWFSCKDQPQKHTLIKGKCKNERDSSLRCYFFEGNPKFWDVEGSSLVLWSLSGVTSCGCPAGIVLSTQNFSLQLWHQGDRAEQQWEPGHWAEAGSFPQGQRLCWGPGWVCGALFVMLFFVGAVLRTNSFLNCEAQVTEGEFCYAST